MDQVLTMTETETVELKKSLAELKQGLISLAAMLNKHGQAELWFGIAPNGKAVGLEINEKTLRDVSQAITAHIEPAIYPHITQQRIDGKHCLHIKAEGWQQPYLAYGRAYMRVADEDKKLSASELKNLILQNNQDALRWENEPSGLTLEQLNPEKISRFLALADLPPDSAASALEKLDLLRQGVPLNAAKLFFSDAPIQLRCAVFATHTSSTIIDRHDFDGDILELIEEAEKYALKNIHIGMRLEGLRRVDVPEIPLKAIREALVNAFCHRDWRDPDFVQVAVFRDRLEIRSPGKLYGGLTFDQTGNQPENYPGTTAGYPRNYPRTTKDYPRNPAATPAQPARHHDRRAGAGNGAQPRRCQVPPQPAQTHRQATPPWPHQGRLLGSCYKGRRIT